MEKNNIKTKEEKKKAKFDVKEEPKEELPQETVFDVFKGIREKLGEPKILNEETTTTAEEEIVKEKSVDEWLKEIEKGLEYFREATMEKIHGAINKLRDEKDFKIEELKREMEKIRNQANKIKSLFFILCAATKVLEQTKGLSDCVIVLSSENQNI